MGWNAWPHQPVQGQNLGQGLNLGQEEVAPPLIPMNPPKDQPTQDQQVAVLPAVEEVLQAQGPDNAVIEDDHVAEEQVLAMDDITDSDDDAPHLFLLLHLRW